MSEAVETNAELEASLRALAEVEGEAEAETGTEQTLDLDQPKPRKVKGTFLGETFEYEIKPYRQPAPDLGNDIRRFVIGRKCKRITAYREAIPYPDMPRPGEWATPEDEAEHHEAMCLWMQAAQSLTTFLWYQHRKRLGEDLYAFENGGTGARMDRTWSWLSGLWQARGMSIPSEEEISRLVDEIHGKQQKR